MTKYQRAYFPMKEIRLVQGYGKGTKTHAYGYPLDMNGKGAATIEAVYAPFDCKITKLYQPKDTKTHANTVWLTSTVKVLCPNGYYGYLTVSITHPEGISKMKLGTTYKQGVQILKEGSTGYAEAPHIHLEVAKGEKAGWHSDHGQWIIDNGVKPEEYLFVREDAIIYKSNFKGNVGSLIKESDITYKVKNVPSEPLIIRTLPWPFGKKNGELRNGDDVIKFNNKALVYHYGILGYTINKYLKK